ncbi:hypothetical protein LAZ67_14002515 [Cordylochernes scorpioides]|uniref:Transposase n=1 Tax=Cordylochernes scorpioides TaxID=51811 RepID=A0ABY6L738_9ARAC|nr:hypothetical protein LAZ67_14002515 [Cordylochernes scorpioides]
MVTRMRWKLVTFKITLLRFSFHGATTGERVHLRTPFCNSFFHGEKLNCGQYSSQFSVKGRQNVHDDERSGSPVTATDNAAVATVLNVVEADRRVTIDEIMIRLPPGIEIRRSSIGTIMSDVLNFFKVCTRWVPRLLLENHKQQRWRQPELSWKCIKEMEINCLPVLSLEMKAGCIIQLQKQNNKAWCGRSLRKVHQKGEGKVMAMENFKLEIFIHPPYSPELAPSDFHLYPALKWHLGGKHFADDDEVQAEANHWLRRQDTAWYNSGFITNEIIPTKPMELSDNVAIEIVPPTSRWAYRDDDTIETSTWVD